MGNPFDMGGGGGGGDRWEAPAGFTLGGGSGGTVSPEGLFGPSHLESASHTTSTTDLPPWAKQYALGNLDTTFGTYYPNGNLSEYPYPHQRAAVFDPWQQMAQNMIAKRAVSDAPILEMGDKLAYGTIGGQFLTPDTNPYLKGAYDTAAQAVTDQYRYATAPSTQAEFARAGAFGGSAQNQTRALQQYGLGRTLNDLANQMYSGAYENERGRQMQMMGLLPTYQQARMYGPQQLAAQGAQRQGMVQTLYDTEYQNQLARSGWPFTAASALSGGISGGLPGGLGSTSSSTSSSQPNPNAMSPLAALLAVQNIGRTPAAGSGGGSNYDFMSMFNPMAMLGGMF